MFNGVTLLIAIGIAGWTGRRRGRAIVRVQPSEGFTQRGPPVANDRES